MRNMSCALTTKQVEAEEKDVTRRLGWWNLKVGERIQLCEKCMGRGPDEPLVRLKVVEVISTRAEKLNAITQDDVRREGFPDKTPAQFIEMFCYAMRCKPDQIVNRIEWKYVKS